MNSNTITVVGNLTKDPILKITPKGKSVSEFTVACNHGWWDKPTQSWVDGESTFFKIECWDALAQNIADSLRKGDPVIVVGRMERRTYQLEGQNREAWELKADTVGPDLRKRSASLRRVLRDSQMDPASSRDGRAADESEDPDIEDIQDVEDVQPRPMSPGLAVAS